MIQYHPGISLPLSYPHSQEPPAVDSLDQLFFPHNVPPAVFFSQFPRYAALPDFHHMPLLHVSCIPAVSRSVCLFSHTPFYLPHPALVPQRIYGKYPVQGRMPPVLYPCRIYSFLLVLAGSAYRPVPSAGLLTIHHNPASDKNYLQSLSTGYPDMFLCQ